MSHAPIDPQPSSEASGVIPASNNSKDGREGSSDGPGCFPAVLAATLLMGMVLFLTFGFAGYLIFQKRGDLAVRTLRTTIITELEQSRLDPESKSAVIGRLSKLADDIESKKLENWQAGGVMNRIVRAPILRWGDLQAVDAWASLELSADEYAGFHKQVTRFYRAAELDRAIASDIQDVLRTVTGGDPAMMLGRLKAQWTVEEAREVALRAKLVADRAEIPDQVFDGISLQEIIDRLIETGMRDGST